MLDPFIKIQQILVIRRQKKPWDLLSKRNMHLVLEAGRKATSNVNNCTLKSQSNIVNSPNYMGKELLFKVSNVPSFSCLWTPDHLTWMSPSSRIYTFLLYLKSCNLYNRKTTMCVHRRIWSCKAKGRKFHIGPKHFHLWREIWVFKGLY